MLLLPLWKHLLGLQIFFLSYQKSKNNLMRKSTFKFKSILRSVSGAMYRAPAVLAGGTQQHVTGLWQTLPGSGLRPFLCLVHSRGPCTLGSCLAWTERQDAPEREFYGVRWMIDSSTTGESERGTAQNPESGSPRWEVREGGRLPRTEERDDFPLFLLNSKTWNTKALWIYAFTDHCGPDFEVKATVEL